MQGLRRRMVLDLSSSRIVSGEVTWFIDLYTEYYIFLKVLFSLVLCGCASKAAFKCGREEKRRKWCLKRKDSPLAVFAYDWVHESACISHQATHL